MKQLENVELKELEREDECCGFGGTFSVKQPMISGEMVLDKCSDVLKTGSDYLLSKDCGWLINIQGSLNKQQSRGQSMHFASFFWERTRGS